MKISFDDAAEKYEAQTVSGNRQPQQGDSLTHNLSKMGVKAVYSLESYRGHVLAVTDKGVLFFDIHRLNEPLYPFWTADGRNVRGATVVSPPENDQSPDANDLKLLVTTSQSVKRYSLLNGGGEGDQIYRSGGPNLVLHHWAFSCAGQTFLLEHNLQDRTSRLVRLPEDPVATFQGVCYHPPVVTKNGRIFFSTDKQFFHYDVQLDILRAEKAPEDDQLISEAHPAYSQDLNINSVFLASDKRLWRVGLHNQDLSPAPLTPRRLGDPRIAAKEDLIAVAHLEGALLLDVHGMIKWDSKELNIAVTPDGNRPRIYSNHIVFTARGRAGGSEILVLHHKNGIPQNFERFPYHKRLLCSPLLSLGKIVAAVGDEESVELIEMNIR